MQTVQIVSIAGSFILLIGVIELVRRGKLKERYSLLWLFSVVVLLLFSIWRRLLDKVAGWFGIAYPPSLLFLVAFIFLLVIILHFSVIVSDLSEKNKTLAQDIALMKARLEEEEMEKGDNEREASKR